MNSTVKDEFNSSETSNVSPKEISSYSEFHGVKEIKGNDGSDTEFGNSNQTEIFEELSEDDKNAQDYLRATSAMSGNVLGLVTSTVATFAFVAIIGTTWVSSLRDISAKLDIDLSDNIVWYNVTSNEDPKNLYIVLNSDSSSLRQELGENYGIIFDEESGNFIISGSFEDLESDKDYSVSVYSSNDESKAITYVSFKTLSESKEVVDIVFNVSYECLCGADGYFHFTIDYEDKFGYYKNFKAMLVDEFGNEEILEIEKPHDEQKMKIVGSNLSGEKARFSIFASRENNQEEIIFESDVEI